MICWDEDNVGSDDVIGKVIFSADDLKDHNVHEQWWGFWRGLHEWWGVFALILCNMGSFDMNWQENGGSFGMNRSYESRASLRFEKY